MCSRKRNSWFPSYRPYKKVKMKVSSSAWVWKGPSIIDGKPIILFCTCITRPSTNRKTSWMVQTYILREDIPPHKAVWEKEDISICGNCLLRKNRFKKKGQQNGCYVNVARAPLQIWNSYQNGNIPYVKPKEFINPYDRPIRQGAYGDPTLVPYEVWEQLNKSTTRIGTSYTHMWNEPWFDKRQLNLSMASVETLKGKKLANQMGAKTYRIVDNKNQLLDDEIMCPQKEFDIPCTECNLCSGSRKSKNIAVLRV